MLTYELRFSYEVLGKAIWWLEMHDEIYHFEVFKNFEIFQGPFSNYFMKLLFVNIKWLQTFKNNIKIFHEIFHGKKFMKF